MIAPNVLTNSSLQTFKDCPQKYLLGYVRRLRTERVADYFRLGGAFHLAVELHGRGVNLAGIRIAIADNYANPPEWVRGADDTLQSWYYEATTVVVLFEGWLTRWAGEGVEVLVPEGQFSVPIRNPDTGAATPNYRLAGKRDQIVRLDDGRQALGEIKTTSEVIDDDDAPYWRRLAIDSQISAYVLAARAEGITVDSVLYDVTRKPALRPTPVALVDDGAKVVLDRAGERVRTKDGKKWRETADAAQGYTLQTRPCTLEEWRGKLAADIADQPGRYYQRREIPRLESDLAEFAHELWHQQKTLREFELSGRWYRNTRACAGVGRGTCQFFDLCTRCVDTSGEAVPAGFRRAATHHEELED